MSTCLLLLLSLVSVDGNGRHLSDIQTMIIEVMNRRVSDFYFYGCQCGFGKGSQIVDDIDRCCHELLCCITSFRTDVCKPETMRYYYTYSNGTLICDDEDESSCARRSCECDRTAVLCFKSHKFSKANARYFFLAKCEGEHPSC